ncbi:hypothetical protein SAMN04488029_4051 [Reichenbachiella faecimaris]|uniref:DUF5723 domain-containing protein n=1 Tax=Reichenbachiella faecimaris TaxID=692418 RepID=A0A1W2GR15_REIFA|nr:DUF5723 family protein [Reichenbachiella faecimaris]SMD39115.1 hypothetical protein SAMN04488029_4051 [Reichenbachiella faecimaris]
MIRNTRLTFLVIMLLLGLANSGQAQSDLTFYHLGELTPQNSIYNPVFFPDADFYISFPVISGVSVNVNNSFTYNDIFDPIEGSDSVQFVPEKLLSTLKNGDRLSFDGAVSLFQVGFHIGRSSAVQIFANERAKSSLYYPKEVLGYLLNGNGDFVGEEVAERNLNVSGTYYREYGIGYSHQLTILGNKQLRVGLKVKYLQGFAQAQVDEGAQVSFFTDEDNHIHVGTNQPIIYTAGFDSMSESDYLISNDNTGVGFDFGADLQISPKLKVALAVNDIGSINWTEGVKNYELLESEATFGGLDLKNLDDIGEVLTDTLEQLFGYREVTGGSFKTKLNTRFLVSGAYKVIPKGTVTATILARNDLGNLGFTYGAGYTHRVGRMLTVSTTVSRKPKQGFAVGAGFGARLGIVQLYTSVDNFVGFTDVRKMQNMNVRVGMNFLFGRRSEKKKQKGNDGDLLEVQPKEKKIKDKLSPFPEEYNLDHLEEID